MMDELPPLPAMSLIDRHLPTGVVIRGYTADQMRAYAAAAVAKERERCALVCENAKANIWPYHSQEVIERATAVCDNLAAAIRATPATPQPPAAS